MDTQHPYSQTIANTLTLEQLKQSTLLLREAHEVLYKKSDDIRITLESTLPYYLVENIFDIVNVNKIDMSDTKKIQEIINEMRSYLENLPVVELVIAFIPTYKDVQKLSEWWGEYTGTHVVIALQIDESIVAGARISYAGVYKDYSLANWMNQHTGNNLDQFL